jgi:hypothetical protein
MATHLHVPHPHVPHPHVDLDVDAHPWRALPITLTVIVLLAAILMIVSFALSKALTGHAY